MRQYDFPSLYRSTIGFDRLFSMLDQVSTGETQSYPPYNIERVDENAYRLTVAAAGFSADDLTIEVKENALTLFGEKKVAEGHPTEMVYRGIAARAFERRFQLADFVQVTGANLENGLLHIDLVREIPEAMKPRLIPINGHAANDQKIETKKAA